MLGVERGCGRRVQGGVYAEAPLSPDGQPIEFFLIDPPRVLDVSALGLSPIGVRVIEVHSAASGRGAWWVFDWVGSHYYPNVADFVEETKRHGLSRRLPRSADFAKLTPTSRMLLFHAKAMTTNHRQLWGAIGPDGEPCPKKLVEHRWDIRPWKIDSPELGEIAKPPEQMCARLWWEDVSSGLRLIRDEAQDPREVVRLMPAFNYIARSRPPGFEPVYQVAAFAQFPITNLAVIRADDGSHEATFDRVAGAAGVPVVLEDE